MKEIELIARQAKTITELEIEVAALRCCIHNAISVLVCVGGPLNDNAKCYNDAQLADFRRIFDYLEN